MRLLRHLVLLLMVLAVLPSFGQRKTRKYSNEFLNIGLGGRGMSLANARTAMTDDIYSMYYNPAGLASMEDDFEISYMHSEHFAGIAKFDFAGVAVPLKDRSTIGVGFIRFGVDDIPNTLFLFEEDGSINYNNIESFSVADYAFLVSYARRLKVEGLSVGGNVKVIHKNVGSFARAWGFGLDAGLQYRLKQWRFGAFVRDLTSTYNAWSFSFTEEEQAVLVSTNNEIPENSVEITLPMIHLGAGYEGVIKDKFFIRPELDIFLNTDGRRNVLFRTDPMSIDAALGLELSYRDIVYVRTGIGGFQWAEDVDSDPEDPSDVLLVQPNLGIGLDIKGFKVDYAFTNVGESEVFYSNVISVSFALDRTNRRDGGSEDETQRP